MNARILICLTFVLTCATWAPAAEAPVAPSSQEAAPADVNLAPVIFHGRELFQLGVVSELSAEQRAEELAERLEQFAKSPRMRTSSLAIREDNDLGTSIILMGDEVVIAVWEQDAILLNKSRREVAEERLAVMAEAIDAYRNDFSFGSIVRGVVFTVIATLVLVILLYLMAQLRRREEAFVERRLANKKIGKVSIGKDIMTFHQIIMRLVRIAIVLWLFTVYLNLVLSFFPWTFGIATSLFDLIVTPLKNFGQALVAEIPDLFALAIIIVIAIYVLRLIKRLFAHLAEGTIKIKGFYSDWADTTYHLVRILVIGFAGVAAFPYIPGSSSPAFKAISIFMGVLFSLGSTSAVANIIAGLILTYMRPFIAGDEVQVSETFGVVIERRMPSTRIRTPKNVMVAIPNHNVLSSHIINYSYMTQKKGLLLHTSVTIGYDVPWRTVHDLLIRAAKKTSDVMSEPEPFVLQTSLADFYVGYELNAATKQASRRPRIYSELHQNIQDVFAEAGVEIMSPHYRHHRDGNESTIPPKGSAAAD